MLRSHSSTLTEHLCTVPADCLSWDKSEEYVYCLHGRFLQRGLLLSPLGLQEALIGSLDSPNVKWYGGTTTGSGDVVSGESHFFEGLLEFKRGTRMLVDGVLHFLRTANLTFPMLFTFPMPLHATEK